MTNGILDRVEDSLIPFRPRNQRQYVALQIARRFQDERRLSRYLNVAEQHPKKVLLEAARLARLRSDVNRTPVADLFFEILATFDYGQGGT